MNHKEFGYIAYYHHLEKLLACNKDFVAYCIQDISFHIDKDSSSVIGTFKVALDISTLDVLDQCGNAARHYAHRSVRHGTIALLLEFGHW